MCSVKCRRNLCKREGCPNWAAKALELPESWKPCTSRENYSSECPNFTSIPVCDSTRSVYFHCKSCKASGYQDTAWWSRRDLVWALGVLFCFGNEGELLLPFPTIPLASARLTVVRHANTSIFQLRPSAMSWQRSCGWNAGETMRIDNSPGDDIRCSSWQLSAAASNFMGAYRSIAGEWMSERKGKSWVINYSACCVLGALKQTKVGLSLSQYPLWWTSI